MEQETRLNDEERLAIMQYVNRPKVNENKNTDKVEEKTEYTGLESSHELLEKVMANRKKIEDTESKGNSEVRERVMKLQRMELIEDMGF